MDLGIEHCLGSAGMKSTVWTRVHRVTGKGGELQERE